MCLHIQFTDGVVIQPLLFDASMHAVIILYLNLNVPATYVQATSSCIRHSLKVDDDRNRKQIVLTEELGFETVKSGMLVRHN